MKHFYKGDVVVKKDDAFDRWAVTRAKDFAEMCLGASYF